MAEDRRVRKTKRAIQNVLCELTKKKKLNEITVKELCALADINKSTFYLHYRDIYDLANSIKNIMVKDICDIIDEYPYNETIEKAPEIWSRVAKNHFKEPNDLGVLVRRPGMEFIAREIENAVIDTLMNKFVLAGMERNSDEFFHHHLYVTFIISGYMGVLHEFNVSEMEHAMIEVSKRINDGFFVKID